jgi:hypothetical protein
VAAAAVAVRKTGAWMLGAVAAEAAEEGVRLKALKHPQTLAGKTGLRTSGSQTPCAIPGCRCCCRAWRRCEAKIPLGLVPEWTAQRKQTAEQRRAPLDTGSALKKTPLTAGYHFRFGPATEFREIAHHGIWA